MPFLVVPIPNRQLLCFYKPSYGHPTYEASSKFHFLESIHKLMDIEDYLRTVGYEYPSFRLEALLVQLLQFLEERRDMYHTSTTDDIYAARVHKTGREDMKVVGDTIRDDGVAGIIAALSATAELRIVGEDISKLSFAFVAPLGAEDDGDGHVPWRRRRGEQVESSRRSISTIHKPQIMGPELADCVLFTVRWYPIKYLHQTKVASSGYGTKPKALTYKN
jgi:hypothetical protein